MKYITAKKDIITNTNMTIRKGTQFVIIKELTNPTTHLIELIIAVDNGTDDLSLMPKDVITKGKIEV